MNELINEQVIDVRTMVPRLRHPTIFNAWNEQSDGGAILIVNDHDPVPLYYQFAAEFRGGFHWEYLEQGPEVWRVRVSKGHFCDAGFYPAARPKASCSTAPASSAASVAPLVLDTRPMFARGDKPCQAIDDAVDRLSPGQPLVIIAPFEPAPLYTKLGKQGFTHQTTPLDGNSWQVEFRRV